MTQFVQAAPLNLDPQITIGTLLEELVVEPSYEGWAVHGIQSGIIPRTKGGSGHLIMDKLGLHPELRQIRLYRVNDFPVILTVQSKSFFEGMEQEILNQPDRTYLVYKFLFFPTSVIRTAHITDPSSKAPIPVYLVTSIEHALLFEKTYKNTNFDWQKQIKWMQELYQRRERALELIEKNPKIALKNLKKIAREGLPIAAAEVAALYESNPSGGYWKEEAEKSGITERPDLHPSKRARATPIPEDVLAVVQQMEAEDSTEEDTDGDE